MENSHEAFERKGERWDTRRDSADPVVQALREFFDKTERHEPGYDAGPVSPVKGRNWRSKMAEKRNPRASKPLWMIERDHWNSLSRPKQEPAPLPHRLLTPVSPPKAEDCWDLAEIKANIERLKRDHELAVANNRR